MPGRMEPFFGRSRTVWKYPIDMRVLALHNTASFALEMPQAWAPLLVDMQDDTPCLWAEVDPSAPPTRYEFRITGTGSEVPPDHRHVGSWQQHGFVWHLYERI